MKRRDFVKNTTLSAAALMIPMGSIAGTTITHFESDDLSPRADHNNGFPLNFIAIGDWGRNGEDHQIDVAAKMGEWAHNNPNDFVISVGDNFYPLGVISENDPQFHYSFENIYTAHSLQCDWFVVLGNHDYGTDPDAQIRYSKISRRWNMPARYYKKEVDLGDNKGKVLFVMIDTDPMLFPEKKEYVDQELAWINDTFANAPADVKWKIVVGHHPCYTVGPRITNYDTITVRNVIADMLEKHKVDIYLSGHDHSLQHLKPEGFTHQFISGAGSELTPVHTGISYAKFQASDNGFMYFSINANKFQMTAINYKGEVLYKTEVAKS
jgi:tartrate-resistant acid phosphatase type 5